jgi:hypothetical protein
MLYPIFALFLATLLGLGVSQKAGCGKQHTDKGALRHVHLTTSDGNARHAKLRAPSAVMLNLTQRIPGLDTLDIR